jgi:hypothetical protein
MLIEMHDCSFNATAQVLSYGFFTKGWFRTCAHQQQYSTFMGEMGSFEMASEQLGATGSKPPTII